ncbi:CocE/NonD family hydrolase C-terminal non-catalytic domain-containing protein [Actinomadura madurae]|uniref:CocE/NonD family hydrolase C-terminal non-catalytic domain-containing protein n=1 Tax=Actinomadura madurae TaxID=1993 RepID=UPI0020D20C95|nr:CocE/NonD family hydrolase C-terminal non-catalytic domain-containing protein [Actinomadura madurae]
MSWPAASRPTSKRRSRLRWQHRNRRLRPRARRNGGQGDRGLAESTHRAGHEQPLDVVPGRTYDLRVHVWPTHYRLQAGHRLRITVSSDDYPEIDSDAPAGRVGIKLGARGSSATLTVLPGA